MKLRGGVWVWSKTGGLCPSSGLGLKLPLETFNCLLLARQLISVQSKIKAFTIYGFIGLTEI